MTTIQGLSYKGLAKTIGSKRVQKALPFVFGGAALGATIWIVAKNWDKITEFASKIYPLNEAQDESQRRRHGNAIEAKPYPMEHTSKKHSKSHVLFKDVQKITQV